MTDILVVSDTHGKWDRLEKVLARTKPKFLLFLGDGLKDLPDYTEQTQILAVRGNCDWSCGWIDAPESREMVFGKYRVFMTHGHRYEVKHTLTRAMIAAAAREADVLLYGHTHVPFEKTFPAGTALDNGEVLKKPLLVVCPGSLGQPQSGKPTFATLTVRENGVLAGFGELQR